MFRKFHYKKIAPSQQERDKELCQLVIAKADLADIKAALHAGANPNASIVLHQHEHARLYTTAFNEAFWKNDAKLMGILSKAHSISTEERSDLLNNTMLIEAVTTRRHAAMAEVLKLKPNLYAQNDHGDTAYHVAAQNGDTIALKLLLDHLKIQQNRQNQLFKHKSPLEIRNKNGFTPWKLAMNSEHHDAATLIEQYAPIKEEKPKSKNKQSLVQQMH